MTTTSVRPGCIGRSELIELSELEALYRALSERILGARRSGDPAQDLRQIRIDWIDLMARAQTHTNLFEQTTRGRAYRIMADPPAGSQAHEPVSSSQAQGGIRIGYDPAALGEGQE